MMSWDVKGSPNPITWITFPLFALNEKRSPSKVATDKISPSAAGVLKIVSSVLCSQSLFPFKSKHKTFPSSVAVKILLSDTSADAGRFVFRSFFHKMLLV